MAPRVVTLALVAAVSVVFLGCGSNNDAKVASQAAAKAHAEDRAKAQNLAITRKQQQLQRELNALKKKNKGGAGKKTSTTSTSTPSVTPSQSSSCGGNLSVGPNTSCAFGLLVMRAYFDNGGGSGIVEAYSPVTQRTYAMTCTAGAPTVCRGGNNASVFIR